MDDDTLEQFELKNTLVELEHEYQHLQVAVRQLQSAVDKRQLEVRKLLSERELKQLRNHNKQQGGDILKTADAVDDGDILDKPDCGVLPNFSSKFAMQVSLLLDQISEISEEISALVRL